MFIIHEISHLRYCSRLACYQNQFAGKAYIKNKPTCDNAVWKFHVLFYGLLCQALVSKIEHSFNNFSIYEPVISHFHIVSHLTELYVCVGERFSRLTVRALCDAYYKERASHLWPILDIIWSQANLLTLGTGLDTTVHHTVLIPYSR